MGILQTFSCKNTAAQDRPGAQLGIDLSLCSKYVWRGLVFDEDLVLQPDIWLQGYGITMTFWGNMDLTDPDGNYEGQFNEWDTMIDFPLPGVGPVSFSGELWYGSFPNSSGQGSSTAELLLWASGDLIGSPTIGVYWDIWQLHGIYVDMSLSHAAALGAGNLFLSTGMGWGDERHNRWSSVENAEGWLDFRIETEYAATIYPNLTLFPGIHYSRIIQEDIRRYYDDVGIEASNLFFSIRAAFEWSD